MAVEDAKEEKQKLSCPCSENNLLNNISSITNNTTMRTHTFSGFESVKEFLNLYIKTCTCTFLILLCIAVAVFCYMYFKGTVNDTVKDTILTPKEIKIQQLQSWIVARLFNGRCMCSGSDSPKLKKNKIEMKLAIQRRETLKKLKYTKSHRTSFSCLICALFLSPLLFMYSSAAHLRKTGAATTGTATTGAATTGTATTTTGAATTGTATTGAATSNGGTPLVDLMSDNMKKCLVVRLEPQNQCFIQIQKGGEWK